MPLALSTSTVYEMCMTAWDTQACHTPAFTATAAYAPANPETLDSEEFLHRCTCMCVCVRMYICIIGTYVD